MKTPTARLCFSIVLFTASFFPGTVAWSAVSLTGPIDQLQDRLFVTAKSKRARDLKRVYDRLFPSSLKGTPAAARSPLSVIPDLATLQKDLLFGDYGYWLQGHAEYLGAVEKMRESRTQEALDLARSAVRRFLQVEENDPYSALLKQLPRDIGLTEILMGDAYCAQNRCSRGMGFFEKGLQRLNGVGGALGRLRPETLQNYSKQCKKFPNEICEGWLFRLASFFSKNSEEMKAIVSFFPGALDRGKVVRSERLTAAYKAPDSDMVAFERGLVHYLEGKYGQSVDVFRRFLDDYPRAAYRFRARYLLAQSLKEEGKKDASLKLMEDLVNDSPLTYYGVLAGYAAQRDVASAIDATLPLAIVSDAQLMPWELIRLKKAEHLVAEGASELATLELKDLKPRDALSSPFLVYLAMLNSEAYNYAGAFSVVNELIQRGYGPAYSSFILRLIFPTPFVTLIKKKAQENGIDPLLVFSVIKQESSFDARAVSNAGAQGLMQLMPSTAADLMPEVLRSNLTDPETNIHLGTKYLGQLIRRFDGNWAMALAGYNAGPGAVDRWLKDGSGRKGIRDFIESIPYRETREYVAAILRNYYWYSRRLGGGMSDPGLFWGESSEK